MGIEVVPISTINLAECAYAVWLSHMEAGGNPKCHNTEQAMWWLEDFCLNSDDGCCFLAYLYGVPAGIITAQWVTNTDAPCYSVQHLFVHREFRGSKVAQKLLGALADWAGEKDAPVYITTEGGPRPFYKSLGFEPTHQVSVSSLREIRERLGG